MKRVKITEEQYKDFIKQFEEEEDSDTQAQEISNMRHNIADLKRNELKIISRDYISTAFMLGMEYEKSSKIDFELQKQILQKLNELIEAIDSFN